MIYFEYLYISSCKQSEDWSQIIEIVKYKYNVETNVDLFFGFVNREKNCNKEAARLSPKTTNSNKEETSPEYENQFVLFSEKILSFKKYPIIGFNILKVILTRIVLMEILLLPLLLYN